MSVDACHYRRRRIRRRSGFCGVGISLFFILFLGAFMPSTLGVGHMSPIALSSGEDGLVCAMEASGNQETICWSGATNVPASNSSAHSIELPSLFALSGGWGYMCGVKSATLEPYCWGGNFTSDQNLVPEMHQKTSYSYIAAGSSDICAIRSSWDFRAGHVDCWSRYGSNYSMLSPPPDFPLLRQIVAGNRFACGLTNTTSQAICWGASSFEVIDPPGDEFESLSSGFEHVCGILKADRTARCWGDNREGQAEPPHGVSFMTIASGFNHSCGIQEDNHEVICWGKAAKGVPVGTAFLVIAASHATCGVREDNLLLDCWGGNAKLNPPPMLLLFSPGLCSNTPCEEGVEFAFNASSQGMPGLTSLCSEYSTGRRICVPCARKCAPGSFQSTPCLASADQICTPCSLCRNASCHAVCASGLPLEAGNLPQSQESETASFNLTSILAVAISGGIVLALLAFVAACLRRKRKDYSICSGCSDVELFTRSRTLPPAPSSLKSMKSSKSLLSSSKSFASSKSLSSSRSLSSLQYSREMYRVQNFRLTELKEATNNFRELNELGRGRYGSVYKAMLSDGRQVAVKRANAAHRIHSNSRDFETLVETLSRVRHPNLVNLIGYCDEMGERLLVYECMSHGTLYDHLHGGLSPLSWALRLKIAVQVAKGIEYLHNEALPRVVHKDIKPSNILLDGEWTARVADFVLSFPDKTLLSPGMNKGDEELGYLDPEYRISLKFTEKSDIFSFGVVLLELLSGRKPIDTEFEPPNLVEWAIPIVKKGNVHSMLDKSVDMPKNLDPLQGLAEAACLCVRDKPEDRPSISQVAALLEQIIRSCLL